jgi:hypothetical protein
MSIKGGLIMDCYLFISSFSYEGEKLVEEKEEVQESPCPVRT